MAIDFAANSGENLPAARPLMSVRNDARGRIAEQTVRPDRYGKLARRILREVLEQKPNS